ncbi:glycosyl hydrolase [Aureococcus anophagefferens]|nr:glycosyl hydrolase [Aureococcus anophagefferens]
MGRAPPWWCALAAAAAPTDHVDVFVGTVKTGNTFPGATWPHGLAQGRKRVIQRRFNLSPILEPPRGMLWHYNSGYHVEPGATSSPARGMGHAALGTGLNEAAAALRAPARLDHGSETARPGSTRRGSPARAAAARRRWRGRRAGGVFEVDRDGGQGRTRDEIPNEAHISVRRGGAAEGRAIYSTFSLWDTYRAAAPLGLLLEPERAADYARSLLAFSTEDKVLPRWVLFGKDTGCARAASEAPARGDVRRGPGGRRRDKCVSRLAARLGDAAAAAEFERRAGLYREYYDADRRLMAAREPGGAFVAAAGEAFDPAGAFEEGTPLQYTFMVPGDAEGLAALLGGPDALGDRLDDYFLRASMANPTRQLDLTTGTIGGHCQGNEPGHHAPYLYNVANRPWRTAETIDAINELYTASEIPGNDDVGQTSAWFAWSALGLYPVDPCGDRLHLGKPLFMRADVDVRATLDGAALAILGDGCATAAPTSSPEEEVSALRGIFALYDPDGTGEIGSNDLENLFKKIGFFNYAAVELIKQFDVEERRRSTSPMLFCVPDGARSDAGWV